MNVYFKRGRWCVADETGLLAKFNTEEKAKEFAGWVPPVEEIKEDAKREDKTEVSKKETSTDKQKTVRNSKGYGKKKVQSVPFSLR